MLSINFLSYWSFSTAIEGNRSLVNFLIVFIAIVSWCKTSFFKDMPFFSFLFISTWISSSTFSLSIEATPGQWLGLAKVRSDTMKLETIIIVDKRIYLYTLLSYHLTSVVRTIHTLYMRVLEVEFLWMHLSQLGKLIRYIKFQQLISHNHLWSLSQRWLKVELNSLFATCNIWPYTKPTK